jgi:hypothetical protein
MWRHLAVQNAGLLAGISGILETVQARAPESFPNFADAHTLVIGSDYSGLHSSATYYFYSFIVTTIPALASWDRARAVVRAAHLLTRHFSFKTLNDRVRWQALPDFLNAASSLHGLTLTLLVSKAARNLFSLGPLDFDRPELAPFRGWKPHVVERLIRATYIVGLLVSGLSAPRQNVLWVTDEDDIAANPRRLRQLVQATCNVTSHLAPHDLGTLRIATAASDKWRLGSRDLLAIPDLIAGALVEVFSTPSAGGITTSNVVAVPALEHTSVRSRRIATWLASASGSLKHLYLALDSSPIVGEVIRRLQLQAIHLEPAV